MANIREVIHTIRNDPVVDPIIGTGFAVIYTSIEAIETKLKSIDSILKNVRRDIHSHHSSLVVSPSKPNTHEKRSNNNSIKTFENGLYFTYFWAVTLLDQIISIPDIHKDVNIKAQFMNEFKDYKNILKVFVTLDGSEQINYTHKAMNTVLNLMTSLATQYATIAWEQRITEMKAARELIEKELSAHRLELDGLSREISESSHQTKNQNVISTDSSEPTSITSNVIHENTTIFWTNLKKIRGIAVCAMEKLRNIHIIGVNVMYTGLYYHIHNHTVDPNYNDMLFYDIIHINVSSILIDVISYKKRTDVSPYTIFKMSDGEKTFEIQWTNTTTLIISLDSRSIRELEFPAIEKGLYILDVRLSYKRNTNNEKYDEMLSVHNHQFIPDNTKGCLKISSEVTKLRHSSSKLYEIIDVGYSYVYDTYNVLSLFGLDNTIITEEVENLLLFNSLSKCIDDPINHLNSPIGSIKMWGAESYSHDYDVSNVVQIMRNENLAQQNNAHKAKGILELEENNSTFTPTLSYTLGRRTYTGKGTFTAHLGNRGPSFISTPPSVTDVEIVFDYNHNDIYVSELLNTGYTVKFKNANGVINPDYQSIVVGELNADVSTSSAPTLSWYYRTGTKFSDTIMKSSFNIVPLGLTRPMAHPQYGFKHETEHILVGNYSIDDISVTYNNYILFGFPSLGPSEVHGDIMATVFHSSLGNTKYGDKTSVSTYTELTYKGRKWNASKASFNIQEMFKSLKHMDGWLVPIIKVTNKDIDKFKPELVQPNKSLFSNCKILLSHTYDATTDEVCSITREDCTALSIKNPSKLILSHFGIWYAGDLLSIAISINDTIVKYIYNPLNIVSHSITNYDLTDVTKRNSDVIMLMKSLQYDVMHMRDELHYIKNLIDNMNKPHFMSMFSNMLWLSGSLTPLVSIVMSGVMLAEAVIDSVTHEQLTYERTIESILYFIHMLIAVRDVKGLAVTNIRISPVIIRSLSQHIRNFRNNITKFNEKTFPRLNGYSKLVEMSPTSLDMTVNCHWRKLSADGNITRRYYKLVEKQSDGTITPLERIHLRSLEKMRIVPLHEYISIRTHSEKNDMEHITFTIYGVSDGNALPTNGALFGRNNTRTLLNIPADTAGIWKADFSRKKDSNDEWMICPWKDSHMSKKDILQASGYDASKTVADTIIQEMYESISYNLLNFNKSVVTRSENIMISNKQLQALDTLILESRHGYQYRLIGNNCQVLSNDIINLIKDPRKKPHWVTEKQYSDYVSALYDSFM